MMLFCRVRWARWAHTMSCWQDQHHLPIFSKTSTSINKNKTKNNAGENRDRRRWVCWDKYRKLAPCIRQQRRLLLMANRSTIRCPHRYRRMWRRNKKERWNGMFISHIFVQVWVCLLDCCWWLYSIHPNKPYRCWVTGGWPDGATMRVIGIGTTAHVIE